MSAQTPIPSQYTRPRERAATEPATTHLQSSLALVDAPTGSASMIPVWGCLATRRRPIPALTRAILRYIHRRERAVAEPVATHLRRSPAPTDAPTGSASMIPARECLATRRQRIPALMRATLRCIRRRERAAMAPATTHPRSSPARMAALTGSASTILA